MLQGVQTFQVKIGQDNQASLHLFSKLGFQEVAFSTVFQEKTCALHVHDSLVPSPLLKMCAEVSCTSFQQYEKTPPTRLSK